MNLNHLYYFRALAKEEHYTRTADMLSITQPSLSHAISCLESELGVKLFEKQGRNAKLTKYGALFLRYVEQSLDMLDEGKRVVTETSGTSGGFIDMGYIFTLGSHFIPNLIKGYLEEKGKNHIHFSFGQGTTKKIVEELKDGKYDLGEEGQIYGFLGPNGAGKSTTMNIITGYLASTEGEVLINGHNILEEPEEAKKCIGYLPELPPVYTDMTVLEYLKFVADLKKIPKDKKATMIEEIMDMVKITDMKNRLIKNLSKGYRQRVGIAQGCAWLPGGYYSG